MTKLATRYACSAGVTPHCDRADGRPTRKNCSRCGSALRTESGLFGVFVWTGDGRYPIGNAVRTFTRSADADAFTTADPSYVVRWISA